MMLVAKTEADTRQLLKDCWGSRGYDNLKEIADALGNEPKACN